VLLVLAQRKMTRFFFPLCATLVVLWATGCDAKHKSCDGGDGSVKYCCNASNGLCGGCEPGFGLTDIQGTAFSSVGKTCKKCSDDKCYTCFFDKRRDDQEICQNYGTDEPPENCSDGAPKYCDECKAGFTVYRTEDNEDICAKDLKAGNNCPKNCTKCNSKGTKCKACDPGYKLKNNGQCKKK
jgi:hypothetical protein